VTRLLAIGASLLVLVVAIIAAIADHDGGASYDRADVERAFAQEGFTLMDSGLFGPGDKRTVALLYPVSQETFFVVIDRNDASAKVGFAPYERMQTAETFDVLRGNVAAISDSGLSQNDRRRVQAAMDALAAGSG
jgi:hypothetical protein